MDWIELGSIWSPQLKGSVVILSHSGTGKQEQTYLQNGKGKVICTLKRSYLCFAPSL